MEFGELKNVEPSKVWKKERKFSAWLKDNFEKLAEAIEMDVEELVLESNVGRYQCDLSGVDVGSGRSVVIENQFGHTNHDHLGKLLTYSAGKDACIVIWISQDFREEHLSVLDWLNRRTDDDVSFFAVKLEVFRIDDSLLVPRFNVLVQPDKWERRFRNKDLSPRKAAYVSFFEPLLEKLKTEILGFTTATRPHPQNWFWVGAGKSGLMYSFTFIRGSRYRIELYISTGTKDTNKEIFNSFYNKRKEIEAITGSLEWARKDGYKESRISLYYGKDVDILDLEKDETLRNDLLNWSIRMAKKFKTGFDPHIASL